MAYGLVELVSCVPYLGPDTMNYDFQEESATKFSLKEMLNLY